ncbi:MAG TPA: FapA family protein [Candidatus Cloacimonadota bacterium]|nr:FapA family protein [Candidatus Cloacimonadota bacterium]
MEKIIGKTEIKINGQGTSVSIIKLYPFVDEENPITKDYILEILRSNNIVFGIDEKVINYYVNRAIKYNKTYSDIIIANCKMPQKKGSKTLQFTKAPYKFDDLSTWSFFERMVLENHETIDALPYPLVFHKKDDVILNLLPVIDNINGKSVLGEEIIAGRFTSNDFFAGENVRFDESKNAYIAGVSGYLLLKDTNISIINPFQISNDKMELKYYNFDKTSADYPSYEDIDIFLTKHKINRKYLQTSDLSKVEKNKIITIAHGIYPGESKDAEIQLFFESSKRQVEHDEKEKIDFREILSFSDVKENEILAVKKMPVKGLPGEDLFSNVLQSRLPKDVVLKCGLNTYKEETNTEMKIISRSDGIVEYKNNIISIFPQLRFNSNIDYSTGNIHAKVNIHINGSVLTGFKVQSEKNIFINGSIEDNCIIEAGGDIYIQNGASGNNTTISAGGNLSIKFVEGCKLNVKGNINVQRFILGSEVECGDSVFVMGAGINLNEKGAIIDCDIKVKNSLMCPTIGNDSGTRTNIQFGFDAQLNNKIDNLQQTIDKLKEQIEEINERFEVDITSPTVYTVIKNFAKSVKDDIIAAIQEKNKLDSKMSLMQKMLDKELEVKHNLLENAKVQITKRLFPPLNLECDGTNKVIDTIQPPSVFYLDLETHWIERGKYFGSS